MVEDMDVKLVLICLYVLIVNLSFVTARTAVVGHYKVSTRSREIKQCAAKTLSKVESTGLRLSETPDECEALVEAWDEEKLKSGGQEYAKLIVKKWIHHPPFVVSGDNEFRLEFPGMFSKMKCLHLNVTWKNEFTSVLIRLYGRPENMTWDNRLTFHILDKLKKVNVYETYTYTISNNYENQLNGKDVRISLLADEQGHLKLQFDWKTVVIFIPKILTLDNIDRLVIELAFENKHVIEIHDITFEE